ncbi:MAG: response regulator transcription factor [Phycisphaeraceae bacterium]|nr:response regulator transcription factor [Phycisphaeraceae bacterium]
MKTLNQLTPREQEILALIGRGLSGPQIARLLHRSLKTIQSHRQAIGRKLGVRNRVQLARIAIRDGLCPLGESDQSQPWISLKEIPHRDPNHSAANDARDDHFPLPSLDMLKTACVRLAQWNDYARQVMSRLTNHSQLLLGQSDPSVLDPRESARLRADLSLAMDVLDLDAALARVLRGEKICPCQIQVTIEGQPQTLTGLVLPYDESSPQDGVIVVLCARSRVTPVDSI